MSDRIDPEGLTNQYVNFLIERHPGRQSLGKIIDFIAEE
jgi:hypothetical protein